MYSCVGTILSSLKEPVMRHGAYVFQYEDLVRQLKQENRGLGEIKDRIERLVDTAKRNGRCIEPGVSSWLGKVEQMERDIANFLRQEENREQMARDFANFLRQQENGEQMERDFANILRQQENGEHTERDIANFLRQQENAKQMEQDFANFLRQQDFANFLRQQENGEQMERDLANFLRQQENGEHIMERDFANFLRQQENGEQMERDFAKFLRQQEDGESFTCFPGCMCPNLMWRHERGMEAYKKSSKVKELIRSGGDWLPSSPVSYDAPFQSELLFDSPHYYTTFPSRASVFADVMNALNDSGVDMIGVYGPGGAGKTTMVKEVAKEAKRQGIFDKIVITVVSKDPNTSKLQEDLASQLDLECAQTESGRMAVLEKALLNGTRKILVILDDLWQALDLKAIGIPISGPGGKGCKIMLTSRRQDVFKGMGVHSTFSIDYLKEDEAWELFRNVTGDFGVDVCTARKVCEKCADLPIAIVAVGAALKGEEEEDVWQNALCELEKSPLKYIEGVELAGYTPLKLSYDSLKDERAKSCFLLCCLFPEDAEISIDDLVRYSFALGFLGREGYTLKDARIKVQSMVYMLKRSCLLLNGKNKNYVKMHDVMRDLAIVITGEKQTEHGGGHDWPGGQQFMVNHDIRVLPNNDAWKHHTAISLRINDNFTFPCGVLDCPLLHTFVLENPGSSYSHTIPNNFFQGMKKVTVLDLKSVSLELPSSILELHQLRMLFLRNCNLLGDLTTIQDLKNHIEILSFEDTLITQLPQEIGKLTHLRSLDLRVWELRVIPKGVISNLIYLEELYVLGTFCGWDTTVDGGGMSNASIAELKSLTLLTVLQIKISTESLKIMVQGCPNLFEKLINFAIFINVSGVVEPIQPLNALKISNTHHTDDEFHVLMGKVFHLLMDKVNEMRLEGIPHLEGLWPQLKSIPSGGGSFSNLTSLKIFACHGMKFLFSSSIARALQKLQTLEVCLCSKLEQIIVVDHHYEEKVVTDEAIIFNRLVELSLRCLPEFKSFYLKLKKTTSEKNLGLPEFKSFYPKMKKTRSEKNLSNFSAAAEFIFDEKVLFPVLTHLEITELPIEYIWSKQAIQSPKRSKKVYFSQLENVYVSSDTLVNVFSSNMLLRLPNLKKLSIVRCPSLTLLVEDFNPTIQSPTIKSKFNDVFPKLIASGGGPFSKLTSLKIHNCHGMKFLFSSSIARELQQLQKLKVSCCSKMEQIIGVVDHHHGEKVVTDEAIIFSRLVDLKLLRLSHFKSFYPKMEKTTTEKNLSNFTATTESIFDEKVLFPILTHLEIDGLSVEYIWNKQAIQSPERSNKIYFSQLVDVYVRNCDNLINVFPSNMLPQLQKLEMLKVHDCPSLTLLVEDLNLNIQSPTIKFKLKHVFPKLISLQLYNLPKLMSDEDYCSYNYFVDL